MKDMLDTKTQDELLRSMLAEVAKAGNELTCAKRDLDKAKARMNFLVVIANQLINRQED